VPLAIIARGSCAPWPAAPQQVLPLSDRDVRARHAISVVYVLCQNLVLVDSRPCRARSPTSPTTVCTPGSRSRIAVAAVRLLGMRLAMVFRAARGGARDRVADDPIYRGSLWTARYDGRPTGRYQALADEDAFYRQPKAPRARARPG